MGETGLIFSEQHFIPLTSLLSSVTEWTDRGLLASWTLRSCVTLGPASVFLFVNGGHNIHLAGLKGSEINNTGSAQHSAGPWEPNKWEPQLSSQVAREGAGEAS